MKQRENRRQQSIEQHRVLHQVVISNFFNKKSDFATLNDHMTNLIQK